jgi:hypothetical protein
MLWMEYSPEAIATSGGSSCAISDQSMLPGPCRAPRLWVLAVNSITTPYCQ